MMIASTKFRRVIKLHGFKIKKNLYCPVIFKTKMKMSIYTRT